MDPAQVEGIEFRDGVLAALQAGWTRIGRPGTVWSGAQRVTIAEEFRRSCACELCAERKEAVSPFAVDGSHGAVRELPAAAVDAVHRIATDPGRLSARWYDEFLAGGIGPAHLVELVAVAASVAAIDTFDRAAGIEPRVVPTPSAGEPSDNLADVAILHTARVPTVAIDDAVGQVAEFYARRESVPNIQQALTLCPDEAISYFDVGYRLYSLGPGPLPDDWTLSRPQVELIAATVSNHNDCFY